MPRPPGRIRRGLKRAAIGVASVPGLALVGAGELTHHFVRRPVRAIARNVPRAAGNIVSKTASSVAHTTLGIPRTVLRETGLAFTPKATRRWLLERAKQNRAARMQAELARMEREHGGHAEEHSHGGGHEDHPGPEAHEAPAEHPQLPEHEVHPGGPEGHETGQEGHLPAHPETHPKKAH